MRVHLAALRALLVATLLLGLGYPLAVTAVARVPGLADRADGSLVRAGGRVVGSSLIGQSFAGEDGVPVAGYFAGRPGGYDPLATGASNLGPESAELLDAVHRRRQAVARANGVDPAAVPPDAVTASGSGLDPDISPAFAALQVDRVARERGLDPAAVRRLVEEHTQGRTLGFLGEPRVNVLELNRALPRS